MTQSSDELGPQTISTPGSGQGIDDLEFSWTEEYINEIGSGPGIFTKKARRPERRMQAASVNPGRHRPAWPPRRTNSYAYIERTSTGHGRGRTWEGTGMNAYA